jgi:hypothetical protein
MWLVFLRIEFAIELQGYEDSIVIMIQFCIYWNWRTQVYTWTPDITTKT